MCYWPLWHAKVHPSNFVVTCKGISFATWMQFYFPSGIVDVSSSVDQTCQSCPACYSLLPQDWHVALLLSYMPGMFSRFTDTSLTCLAAFRKKKKKLPCLQPINTNTHAHADSVCVRGHGWNRTAPAPSHARFWCTQLFSVLLLILCLRWFKRKNFESVGGDN